MNLKEQVKRLADNLELLNNFASKYDFPDGVVNSGVYSDAVNVTFDVGYSEADRINVLVLAGETLGRNGWVKKVDWNNEFFTWSKTVNGVRVLIDKAERVPIVKEAMPVPPTDFPLQLVDRLVEEKDVEVAF